MTGPFRSIKDMVQNPLNTKSKPANHEQPQQSIDDVITNFFGKGAASSSNPSADHSSGAEGCSAHDDTGSSGRRHPLQGGKYSEADALALLNSHFMVGKSKNETAIFRINDDETISFVPTEEFKLAVQNIFVDVGRKQVPAEKYWRESPNRHERALVFKPGGTTRPHEYNLWRGFGVELRKGWQKQRSFLRHLRRVICRRDQHKFKYMMRLLAWFVQNPDKHAGVVLVLKSREQGTGKSTVGKVMLDIFGQHGFLVDDKDRLLGRFNDWLETACFVLAEEILFAGDLKSADKMKSIVTGDILQVEGKFRSCRQVLNHAKFIACTNHDHAVAAGSRDRRNVVYDVSNEYVGNKDYFNTLYRDLAEGGTSEFLWLLQSLQLGDWHPRLIIKTEETAEQQRMSGDSVSQWSQACITADAIADDRFGYLELGKLISFSELLNAYTGFCKKTGLRPLGPEVFGKACTEMFGPRRRLSVETPADLSDESDDLEQRVKHLLRLDEQTQTAPCSAPAQATPTPAAHAPRRPWGYDVPDGETWQRKIDARLGVRQ
jgi:hypothetical protein